MANRKDYETFYGDEEQMIEKIFLFGGDNTQKFRNKMYSVTFVSESNQAVVTEIAKYLLHSKHLSPYQTEKIINRYAVLFVYSYLSERGIASKVKTFESLLSNFLSVEALDSDDFSDEEKTNEFVKIYLKDKEFSKVINNLSLILTDLAEEGSFAKTNLKKAEADLENAIQEGDEAKIDDLVNIVIPKLKSTIDKSNAAKSVKTIDSLLKKESHYFYTKRDIFNNVFETNAKKYDEIISSKLVDREFFNYTINIDKENFENFNANFHATTSKEYQATLRKMIFGYLVYDCIKNDNLSLDKPVDLLDPVVVKVLLAMKNANTNYQLYDKRLHSIIEFVDYGANGIKLVNKAKIIPFNFTYNDQLYRISKSGIEKINN